MSTSGTLNLTVIEAKLTRDTETFGKMDPYCVLETRQQQFKTVTHENAGKAPKWDQTFKVDVKYIGDDLTLTVFDEDVTGSDKVGSATIKLSALCVNGGLDDWYEIQYKGKKSGTVHIKGVF